MNPFIAPAKYQSFNRIDGKGFGPAGSGFKPAGSGMMGCVNASCRSGMGMYGLPM
jgi:hypothetical protein